MSEVENSYKESLEEKIIFCLADRKGLEPEKAMDIYYNSRLASLIESGAYGIQYLDFRVLTDELEKKYKSYIEFAYSSSEFFSLAFSSCGSIIFIYGIQAFTTFKSSSSKVKRTSSKMPLLSSFKILKLLNIFFRSKYSLAFGKTRILAILIFWLIHSKSFSLMRRKKILDGSKPPRIWYFLIFNAKK